MFRLFSTTVLLVTIAAGAGAQVPGPRSGSPRDTPQRATRTGKIAGRVVSAESGSPLRRAQININSREAEFTRRVTTGSDGRYEFAELPPGRYSLSVSREGYVTLEYGQVRPFEDGKPLDITAGQVLDNVDFSLPRGAAITGRITDELGDPITDVEVQALRRQFANGQRELVLAGRTTQTNDLGAYRIFGLMPGDYIVRASPRDIPLGPATEADQVTYPTAYYPGVIDVRQAQTVTVSLGQEVSSVVFPLVLSRLSRVSGTVIGSNGRPLAAAIVRIRAPAGTDASASAINAANSGDNRVREDGSFELKEVPPGEYVLDIQQRNTREMPEMSPSQLEFASITISVSGDIDNISVVTMTAVTVSGRVVYQGGKPPESELRVTADAPGAASVITGPDFAAGRVDSDGTFELPRVSGLQMIGVQGIPPGWMLKDITIAGMNITDTPYDFRVGNSVTDLVITLTDRLSEIRGSVHDGRGRPVADYVLVVFPEDARLWAAWSRYVQTTRPNQSGTYSMKGLPAGRYFAALVPALENGLQNDPAVLEQLRAGARSFSLTEGQTLDLNLEMTER